MKKLFILSFLTLISALGMVHAAGTPSQKLVVLSPVYTIDKKFKSMEGPQSTQPVYLLESEKPELVWITGIKTEMVGEDGKTPALPELMCHVNLDYDLQKHAQLFNGNTGLNSRMLTLSQGQLDAKFPEGFGMPLMSNEPISMTTQVLNFNIEKPNIQVRHKVTFEFIRDADLKTPMKALFNTSGFGMALIEGDTGHFGIASPDKSTHGDSCLPGEAAPNANGGSIYNDQFQRKFSGHWVVKPGREVNPTNVTQYLNLPYDTTLHYAAVHLHPFAEGLELRDITAKKTVFKSKARSFKDRIGLDYVTSFSSKKGVPLFKDHQYELISTYNNTTSTNQDSMAVMLLFLHDKRFTKPSPETAAAVIAETAAVTKGLSMAAEQRPQLILRTTLGDLRAELYPDVAPQTVAQVMQLVRAGVYDLTPFYRIEPQFVIQTTNIYGRSQPLTADQKAQVHKLPAEFSAVMHERGILSMAREDKDINSGETSFSILLNNAPHLDQKYTVFGKVTQGWEVLKALENTPHNATFQPSTPLEIKKAEVFENKAQASKVKLAGPKRLPKPPTPKASH
jgi:cyclophilin family peptidyl-prolyl cis-trans isomerase